ncbi:lysozyme [Hymenobacter sp. BT683]|uniref:Lysozyme n=1 Tax=Hymenobacter jeongseonensis TaxID=2791027 RepID=A0ABS0INW5_9BACT|nr:lysozyme [Hymenobacter jeongseonensis]MBF9239734.1 lysozyme [Hymenobacter jeongseonensis]
MKISPAGLDLIKREERFMARKYFCSAGKATIGYGHVILHGEEKYLYATLSEAEASALLQRDVDRTYGAHVAKRLTRAVTQTQFDAMVSLCFNIGTAGFDKSSVLRLANLGSTDTAAITAAFGAWNKVTNPRTRVLEPNRGLTLRRGREAALFLQR